MTVEELTKIYVNQNFDYYKKQHQNFHFVSQNPFNRARFVTGENFDEIIYFEEINLIINREGIYISEEDVKKRNYTFIKKNQSPNSYITTRYERYCESEDILDENGHTPMLIIFNNDLIYNIDDVYDKSGYSLKNTIISDIPIPPFEEQADLFMESVKDCLSDRNFIVEWKEGIEDAIINKSEQLIILPDFSKAKPFKRYKYFIKCAEAIAKIIGENEGIFFENFENNIDTSELSFLHSNNMTNKMIKKVAAELLAVYFQIPIDTTNDYSSGYYPEEFWVRNSDSTCIYTTVKKGIQIAKTLYRYTAVLPKYLKSNSTGNSDDNSPNRIIIKEENRKFINRFKRKEER